VSYGLGKDFNPTTDITIERILDGLSVAASQQPAGTGQANAAQIEFGPAVNDGSDPIQLAANGDVTVNTTGLYRIKISLQFGRTGASGTSILLFRVSAGGTQLGRSVSAKLNNANEDQYFENDTWVNLPAGTVLKFEIMRDAAGNDSGGLFETTPSAEAGVWNNAPSAAIRIERWV
jgi:hypothetical protein